MTLTKKIKLEKFVHLGGLKYFKYSYEVCESLKNIWIEERKTELQNIH